MARFCRRIEFEVLKYNMSFFFIVHIFIVIEKGNLYCDL